MFKIFLGTNKLAIVYIYHSFGMTRNQDMGKASLW